MNSAVVTVVYRKLYSLSPAPMAAANCKLVKGEEAYAFVVRCMQKAGTALESSRALADVIVKADARGVFSHGLNRLEMYAEEVRSGICDGKAFPTIINETPATGFVNGNNAIGMIAGQFCMDIAIAKAKKMGVAWVNCVGSNHYGMACYYAQRAADQKMIGITGTNTSPLIVPPGAKKRALGSNPLCVVAPGKEGDSFSLDMATSVVAYGKVEYMSRKKIQIPMGWGVDSQGKDTTDPAAVLEGGGLQAIAGVKGYGLAMLIDILTGVLSDGPSGLGIRKFQDNTVKANKSQIFIALDPNVFAPGFDDRLQTYIDEMRSLEPSDPSRPVMIAGDPEKQKLKQVKDNGGILYDMSLITAMDALATRLEVEPMKNC